MKKIILAFLLISVIVLSACTPSKKDETKINNNEDISFKTNINLQLRMKYTKHLLYALTKICESNYDTNPSSLIVIVFLSESALLFIPKYWPVGNPAYLTLSEIIIKRL